MSPNLIAFCRIIKRRCLIKGTLWQVPSSSVFNLFSPFLLLFWHKLIHWLLPSLAVKLLQSDQDALAEKQSWEIQTQLFVVVAWRSAVPVFTHDIYTVGDVQKLWLLRHMTFTEVFKHFHSLAIFHTSWKLHSLTSIGCSQYLWKLQWDFIKSSYNPVGLMMQNLNHVFSDI